jgi:hypothetical protein
MSVNDRFRYVAGDIFNMFQSADAHFIKHVLHEWKYYEWTTIHTKTRNASESGTRPFSVNTRLLIQIYHNHAWLVAELVAREQRKSTRNFCGVVSLEVSQALEQSFSLLMASAEMLVLLS